MQTRVCLGRCLAPGGHPVLEQLMWLDIEGTLSVFGQIYRIVQRIPRGLDKFVKHATIIIKEAQQMYLP